MIQAARKSTFSRGYAAGPRARPALDDTRISERDIGALTLRSAGLSTEEESRPPAELSPRWRRAARRAASAEWFPAHVRACANNPQRTGRWTLALWERPTPLDQTRIAYTCGSYRCPSPECQRAAAHRDFAKLSEAVSSVRDDSAWCLLVLTIDQRETLAKRASGNGWQDEQEAFRCLSKMTRNFLARLRRWHERNGWASFGNRWVATVEVQANGWPHINLMVHSPGLAQWLDECPEEEVASKDGKRTARAKPLRGELRDHAVACDWGSVGYADRARNRDALAGYLVKLSGNLEATSGEIAKLTQTPTNARMKLRRIRAGKGFIRSRERSGRWTGIMLARKKQRDGETFVKPLMEPDQVRCAPEEQPAYLEGVREAIRAEQAQADEETRGARERCRVESVEWVPPIVSYLRERESLCIREPGGRKACRALERETCESTEGKSGFSSSDESARAPGLTWSRCTDGTTSTESRSPSTVVELRPRAGTGLERTRTVEAVSTSFAVMPGREPRPSRPLGGSHHERATTGHGDVLRGVRSSLARSESRSVAIDGSREASRETGHGSRLRSEAAAGARVAMADLPAGGSASAPRVRANVSRRANRGAELGDGFGSGVRGSERRRGEPGKVGDVWDEKKKKNERDE